MIAVETLEAALEQAVAAEFINLFSVFYRADDPPQAQERFIRGLQKLIETERAAANVIGKDE